MNSKLNNKDIFLIYEVLGRENKNIIILELIEKLSEDDKFIIETLNNISSIVRSSINIKIDIINRFNYSLNDLLHIINKNYILEVNYNLEHKNILLTKEYKQYFPEIERSIMKTELKKINTLRELKELINSLSENNLDCPFRIVKHDEDDPIHYEILKEDWFMNGDYYYMPLNQVKEEYEQGVTLDNKEFDRFLSKGFILKKGSPMFMIV